MKAILLAGGTGSRMWPTTMSVNKHLLPVYNKPMIYYSLSVLLMCKIKEILIISDQNSINLYKKLLGNGSNFGINIKFLIQKKPNGIPEAFLISKKYIKNQKVCLLLGDNFFYGHNLYKFLKKGMLSKKGAFFYTYSVNKPEDYAVINHTGKKILNIEEKPKYPKSDKAIPGIYFFDKNVSQYAKTLKQSKRKEYEIVDLINIYIKKNNAEFGSIGRGISWLDMGSFNDLNDCSNFIKTIETRQNFMIGSPEEIAWRNKWISKGKLKGIAKKYKNSYGDYLKKLIFKK